ncbi:hypothetical protein NHX12_015654 [Muraenolepis orangiensis]|uniref:Histone PARylation factor 1 n=1 Tax=Muraenolepis orangiensis TaxID=630683 RepID=A0A9Q0D7R5_9TELE|nr:hypothetical protein NHX12_015654 [Muraenolepis orangiensis]
MTARGKRKSKPTPEEEESKERRVLELRRLERLYGLRLPDDLHHFWAFCRALSPLEPREALMDTLGLRLVGPFDLLAQELPGPQGLPGEFQTVLRGSPDTQHHMGYYRDSPDSLPSFVGESEAQRGCGITPMGDNVFAAVLLFLQRKRGGAKAKGGAKALADLEARLRGRAEALGLSLEWTSEAMRLRNKKVVAKTFHGAGIVVPVDRNEVGYRELPETDGPRGRGEAGGLRPAFANDECDYGMGYELGVDLFCHGSHYFHKVVLQLLPMAYRLLGRDLFGEILEAHLSRRSRGSGSGDSDLDQLLPSFLE